VRAWTQWNWPGSYPTTAPGINAVEPPFRIVCSDGLYVIFAVMKLNLPVVLPQRYSRILGYSVIGIGGRWKWLRILSSDGLWWVIFQIPGLKELLYELIQILGLFMLSAPDLRCELELLMPWSHLTLCFNMYFCQHIKGKVVPVLN
jgi:hypothetical protein